jgi:hypothetical protein
MEEYVMKKFLMTSALVAVGLVPAGAIAKNYTHKSESASASVHITAPAEGPTTSSRPLHFALQDATTGMKTGEKVSIEGEKIYLIQANGAKAFAPNGPYTAPNGVTYYALDGLVETVEAPEEIVYIEADLQDRDRDGYTDNVDVDVNSRKADVRKSSY